jgi:hypothetical protein
MWGKKNKSESSAWYRPNGFMITLPSGIAIVDSAGLKFRPLDADDFSIVFHEYIHYLQNIATPSGFHSFRSAFDIWRLFRETVGEDGTSTGSAGLPPQKQLWLFPRIGCTTSDPTISIGGAVSRISPLLSPCPCVLHPIRASRTPKVGRRCTTETCQRYACTGPTLLRLEELALQGAKTCRSMVRASRS